MPDPFEVHRSALVLDGHADTVQRFLDEGWDFTSSAAGGMLDLASARAGNLAGEFFAIWVEPTQWRGRYAARTFALIEAVREQTRRQPQALRLCTSCADVLSARRDGVFAALMGIEGGHSVEGSLDLLRRYYALGVRYMTLAWANSNEWIDSSGDLDDPAVPHHGGLAPFGREVVAEMNRLGMMVDVSHVSDQAFYDVLATTTAPVIASHSSVRALTDSPRNLTDEMLRAVAANGGVVMINFFSAFVDERWRQAWVEQKTARTAAHDLLAEKYRLLGTPVPYHVSNAIDRRFAALLGRATLSSLVDHFDYAIRVAGADHVGVGSDFDGIPATPEGMDTAADLPRLTAALLERGHSASDLTKILGGNVLRVLGEVERRAQA